MSAPSRVTLRPAQPEDASAIAEIWYLGWRDGHLGSVPSELIAARPEASFHTRAARRTDDTVVAVVDGHLGGFVMVAADEIEQLYVSASHRGQGVADLLIAEGERAIKDGGHPRAWLAVVAGNTRARRFYERRGWSNEGPFDYAAAGEQGTITVPCLRYVKKL